MNASRFRNSCLLVLTALIWGVAFVAQSEGGDAVGPFSFNCIRSLIGSAVLLPVIAFFDRLQVTRRPESPEKKRTLIFGGICCGTVLAIASNLQQAGLSAGASAGKAGFLTACYIILVPLLGLFFRKKCHWNVWVGVFFALIGLYLLCVRESLRPERSDILLLLCALFFSFHILVVDHFSPLVDGVRLSCIQFFVSGLITAVPMLLMECGHTSASWNSWMTGFCTLQAWIPILYAGVCSCGIAYTLQIIGQQNVDPTIASLLMSLESVFSVLAGFVLLGQKLSLSEIIGCILVFTAIIFAQLPITDTTPR